MMKISSLGKIFPLIGKAASEHLPQILTITGVCGFVTSTILAVRATPVAYDIHREYSEMRKEEEADEKELLKSELKELAPLYLPAIGVGVGAIVCILYGSHMQAKRTAAVLAAYSLTEKTLETYQENVMERLGYDEHKAIMQEVSDKLANEEKRPPFDADYSYLPGSDGLCLCYDRVTGRYFRSSKDKILTAEGAINKRLLNEFRVTIRDFYDELGLLNNSDVAEALGWDATRVTPDIYFTSMLDELGNPCLVLNYNAILVDRKMF